MSKNKNFHLVLMLIMLIFSIGCGKYEKVEQSGIIVDVQYHKAYNSVYMQPVPCGKTISMSPRTVYHPEQWEAHIHYCDSICVTQTFDHIVYKGDSVKRIVNIRIKNN